MGRKISPLGVLVHHTVHSYLTCSVSEIGSASAYCKRVNEGPLSGTSTTTCHLHVGPSHSGEIARFVVIDRLVT